jgi:transposase
MLKLVVEGRFPRLWTADQEQRDLRQLVLHRHKLVEIRSRVKNELQHLSLNKGMQRKGKLWSQAGQKMFRELPLKPWAACRRGDLLGLLVMLNQQVGQLDTAVQHAAELSRSAVPTLRLGSGQAPSKPRRMGQPAKTKLNESFPW